MAAITIDTTVTLAGDGRISLQEAFAHARQVSITTGQEITIRFSKAIDISVMTPLVVPGGAKIVLDGTIEGSTTTMPGGNAVTLHGDSGAGYVSNGSTYDHTLIKVAQGGSLRLSDVALAGNLVAGAAGKNGLRARTGCGQELGCGQQRARRQQRNRYRTGGANGLGGALRGNLQSGLFAGHVINFAAGQSTASVYVFGQSDGIQGTVDGYRFTISAASGGVPGGISRLTLT